MKHFVRLVCMILVICLVAAVPAYAEAQGDARASSFFLAHSVSISKESSTLFYVCFDVVATGAMDELGATTIEVQRSSDGENWERMRTYRSDVYSHMLCQDTSAHGGYVTYSTATPGYYYRAYITLYAKNSTGTGIRYRYTQTVLM